jgi:hypothetical protein
MPRQLAPTLRLLAPLAVLFAACTASPGPAPPATAEGTSVAPATDVVAPLAKRYVELVLATGELDDGYVDAYYGPPQWREDAKRELPDLAAIRAAGKRLVRELGRLPPAADELGALRRRYLRRQTEALLARLDLLGGKRLTFDQESRALYDAVSPRVGEQELAAVVREVGALLPGEGPVHERLERFREGFVVPRERLGAVFDAAIAACRERTAAYLPLPAAESFTLEYVTDKPWSGYNWYQGGYRSLIQVNVELPVHVDRAVDLACHEGYPGHHVYNALLEQELVVARGFVELSVYALYSPQSLIAEGTANYGRDLAFPPAERMVFERETVFPLAGLDPASAATYYRVQQLTRRLSYAGNEAARRYLDGEIDGEAAIRWLQEYGLYSPERARQRLRFIDTYRAYVINYNLGEDLVRAYVQSRAGDDPTARWRVFGELLSTPRLPSDLVVAPPVEIPADDESRSPSVTD